MMSPVFLTLRVKLLHSFRKCIGCLIVSCFECIHVMFDRNSDGRNIINLRQEPGVAKCNGHKHHQQLTRRDLNAMTGKILARNLFKTNAVSYSQVMRLKLQPMTTKSLPCGYMTAKSSLYQGS